MQLSKILEDIYCWLRFDINIDISDDHDIHSCAISRSLHTDPLTLAKRRPRKFSCMLDGVRAGSQLVDPHHLRARSRIR